MNLRSLSFKNVWRNRGRYLAYLFSATFSVTVYFLYTALAEHPDLREGFRGAEYVRFAIEGAAVVIAVFTFLFLLYSGAAFARFRMKEFGLLTLLGLTKRQMVRIILWENLMVAVAALAIGLLAGVLFLKLFFMAVSSVLGLSEELRFFAGRAVWIRTVAVFGSFFTVVSLASMRQILRGNIIDLIRAERKPKARPTFSRWKALLGAVLVVGGYAWASVPNPFAVIFGVVPVTAMVSFGTFLLFREGSISLLNLLHRREAFFYRPRPFLIISQLLFKMQDNYRALSAVALLVAVILSAVGTVYSVYMEVGADSIAGSPHALQLVFSDEIDATGEIAAVERALERHDARGLVAARAVTIRATLGKDGVNVLAQSTYRQLYRPSGVHLPLEGDEEAVLVVPSTFPLPAWPAGVRKVETLEAAGARVELSVVPDYSGALFNGNRTGGLIQRFDLIVSDQTFARLLQQAPSDVVTEIAMWSGQTWQSRGVRAAIKDLRAASVGEPGVRLTTTLETYQASMRELGLTLFIGIFVSLVFFAATCSLLYFRLFTEIDEDRRYYRKLSELGLESKEIYRLSRSMSAVIFLVPFLIGLVHSSFAMNALGTLLMRTVLHWGWFVALGYLVVYAGYFAATHALYWQAASERGSIRG